MNTSVDNIYNESYYNTSSTDSAPTNFLYNNISEDNLNAINVIKSFSNLQDNWDTYGAVVPSYQAIQKAVTFILWLAKYKINVFFVAPSPNGEVIVEIKNAGLNLEFEFSNEPNDTICASQNGEYVMETDLNDTTQISYIKWLICPDGNCPPNF